MHNIKLWSPNNKKTNLHKFINQLDKDLNIKNNDESVYGILQILLVKKKVKFLSVVQNMIFHFILILDVDT